MLVKDAKRWEVEFKEGNMCLEEAYGKGLCQKCKKKKLKEVLNITKKLGEKYDAHKGKKA